MRVTGEKAALVVRLKSEIWIAEETNELFNHQVVSFLNAYFSFMKFSPLIMVLIYILPLDIVPFVS